MSNGASLAPQEINILLAVLPETKCQGLFNQFVELHKGKIKADECPYFHFKVSYVIS